MDISSPTTTIVKSSRLKSLVWNDFDRVKKGDTCVAICRHCNKKLSGSSTSGTSHLRNHLIRCRRRSNHDIAHLLAARDKKKDGTITIANFNMDQDQKNDDVLNYIKYEDGQPQAETIAIGSSSNFDQKRSRLDLARMIILHGYPLYMVEHVGFRIFVKNLQPLFEPVSVTRVEADCMEIFGKEKQKVYEVLDKLPGKISLSADTWIGSEDAEYLCLTARYIDETWQIKKKILNFIMVDPFHTEDIRSEVIMRCLMEWDIDRKLFSMTFDSSPSNDNIVFRIRDRLSQNRFLFCDGQLFDVRCAANVTNLMVQDALEAGSEVTHKIRDGIQYVRNSQASLDKFGELARQIGLDTEKCLIVDNPWRWDTAYFMLEVAVEYRGAFSLLQEQDPVYTMCLSDTEWERASAISVYLKFFFEVTNVFTGTMYPTSSIYFPEVCAIYLRLIEWCKSSDGDDYLGPLVLKMKTKFDDFWQKCNLGLAIAAVLDPRYKMRLVEYYYPQIYGTSAQEHIDDVTEKIKALYGEHALSSPLASGDQGLTWQVSGSGGNDTRDRLEGFDKYLNETTETQSTKSDLEKYLEEPLFPRNIDFSILDWWRVHTPRYPILSMMARNVLGIPMSKVGVDSAFNSGSRVLDQYRSSLNPTIMEALMCSQDWLQHGIEDVKPISSHSTFSRRFDAN